MNVELHLFLLLSNPGRAVSETKNPGPQHLEMDGGLDIVCETVELIQISPDWESYQLVVTPPSVTAEALLSSSQSEPLQPPADASTPLDHRDTVDPLNTTTSPEKKTDNRSQKWVFTEVFSISYQSVI